MVLKHSLYDALRLLKQHNIISSAEQEIFNEKVSTIPNEPIKSNITITKKEFMEFERLRHIPHINMYRIGNNIVDYSNKISKVKVNIIVKDYETYRCKFKG